MMTRIAALIIISLIPFIYLPAQHISGTVYDAKFDRPIEKVNIVIDGTNHGATTDKNGNFKIDGLKDGKYEIRASLVGFLTFEKEIEISGKPVEGFYIYLQPTSIALDNDFVITARRIETTDFNSPEPVSVVNSMQLEQDAPRSVPEALIGATGVFLQKTNHGGGSPFIRGLTGNQNLLLIDGIRLNNATFRYGPNQYLNTVDQLMVEKLEVIRGAGSVLYGSDALGGVINVLTKNPAFSTLGFKAGGNVFARWMSDDMEKTGRAEVNLSGGQVAFCGGFTYKDFGDIVAGGDIGKQTPTGYTQYSGDAKFRVKLQENRELDLAYQYDKQENVPRDDKIVSGYSKYHFDPQVRQLAYARFKTTMKNKWFKQVSFTGSFGRSDETRVKQKDGSEKVTNEMDMVNTFGGTIEINSYLSETWHFVSGVEYYFDKVSSETIKTQDGTSTKIRGYYPDGATSSGIAVFTSHTLDVHNFSFIMGGRFNANTIKADDNEFGNVDISPSAVVGSFSAVYHLGGHYNFIGSVYSAFRAPNINDLGSFGTFNYGIEVPNPDLRPEKSLNLELGVKAKYERVSGSIFLYHSRLANLIDRVEAQYNGQDSLNGEKVYKKENIARAYIQGFEAEVWYEFVYWLSAYGNITYTYGQNETNDEPMRRIPPLNGKLGLYYKCKCGFWGRLELLSAGKQNRLSSGDISDSRIPDGGTPGWTLLNLRAGYNWKWFDISGGLNNIFDEAYRMHGSGVDGYGRSVWLAVKVGF
jgi:outer membrane receptor protein involved in Fe transport